MFYLHISTIVDTAGGFFSLFSYTFATLSFNLTILKQSLRPEEIHRWIRARRVQRFIQTLLMLSLPQL
mgnify:CR=1 FL=1